MYHTGNLSENEAYKEKGKRERFLVISLESLDLIRFDVTRCFFTGAKNSLNQFELGFFTCSQKLIY